MDERVSGRSAVARSKLLFPLGIACSALFLWLAMRDVDIGIVWRTVLTCNLWWGVPFAAALSVFFWLKAFRWRLLLGLGRAVGTRAVLPPVVIGYASNFLLPAQLGELVRVYLARRGLGIEYMPLFVTIVLERMFDLICVISIVGIVLLFTHSATSNLIMAGYVAGAGGFALVSGVVVYTVWTRPIHQAVLWVAGLVGPAFRERCDGQLGLIDSGLTSLRDVRRLLGVGTVSVVQWGVMGLCTYTSILAIGLDVPVSAGFVVLIVTVIGISLPSAPGFFGAIQLSFTLGLTQFGVTANDALSASLVFHAWLLIVLTLGALFLGYTSHARLPALVRQAASSDPVGE